MQSQILFSHTTRGILIGVLASFTVALPIPAQQDSPTREAVVMNEAPPQPVIMTEAAIPEKPAASSAAGPQQSVATAFRPVRTSIAIDAADQTLRDGMTVPYNVTRSEVLSSAGTWGDFSRFLQLLPGVVWNSDLSNDVLVRGGNPSENLYVLDGIEVPNINHLAMEGTTGGFTSMIDTSTISSVDMKPGTYDARYSNRLSSLIEIHTLDGEAREKTRQLNFGISGLGGLFEQPVGPHTSLLLTAHRSVLNWVTDDIGINGVPIYTDGLGTFEWSPTANDHISVLNLSGADSIDITPDPCDPGATSAIQMQYEGSRSTTGLVWHHIHGSTMASTLTASFSGQNQAIGQQQQLPLLDPNIGWQTCRSIPVQTLPVYNERTHDGLSSLEYGLQFGQKDWLLSVGVTGRLASMNYAVAQPQGQQSPFNTSPTWTDADSFARQFATGQTAVYAEGTKNIGARWSMIAGVREETFALTGAHVFAPRASLAFRVSQHQTVNVTFGRSAQLVP